MAGVRNRWKEIWIEIVPEQDGQLQINFQGEYYRKLGEDDARYRAGTYLFVAQVDFQEGDRAGRVYFTTHRRGELADASYPQSGFSVLGPVPRDEIDLASLMPSSIRDQPWTTGNGTELAFNKVDSDLVEPFSTEVVPIRGRWDNHNLEPCNYLLRSTVASTHERTVRLQRDLSTVPQAWLNGQAVHGEIPGASGVKFSHNVFYSACYSVSSQSYNDRCSVG